MLNNYLGAGYEVRLHISLSGDLEPPKSDLCWLRFFIRVSTGISGYGLRTEMIRKFFPFPLWKRFRNSKRFFYVNRKFPERCSGITERYGIVFRKIPDYGTIVPGFSGNR